MSEVPKYHEIIPTVRDIVRGIGEFVVDKIIPSEAFDEFLQGGASQMLDDHLEAEDVGRED